MNFPSFLTDLIDAGIEVSISKNDKFGYYFDLNLQAKSHMYLYEKPEGWFVNMRYEETYKIESTDDLKREALYGMHERDYINPFWAEFIGYKMGTYSRHPHG